MNYEVFISYRRDNKEVAEQVFKTLTQMRHRVFFDTVSLNAGDFTDHIRKAIGESELVVSILTCDSINRMVEKPETDMVRLELQECRDSNKMVRFFWLCDGEGPQRDLYKMLEQHKDDAFFQWLLRQNITPFQGDEAGVREACRLALKAVELGSQRLVLKVGDKEYVYYGETRVTWKGVAFPWGQGEMVENSGEDTFLVYEGKWNTLFDLSNPPMYVGTGTIYRQKRDGERVRVYEGHWTNLFYDDENGTLYEDDGETVKLQGCFSLYPDASGSFYRQDDEKVPHIVAYVEGDDVPIFRGEAARGAWSISMKNYGRGEVRAPSGAVFIGRFGKSGKYMYGELRIPCGDSFHVYRGQVEEAYNIDYFQPYKFGRMEYADGSSYEGFWRNGKWDSLGVLVIRTPRFDVRIEGSFENNNNSPNFGGHPNRDTRELRISLRRPGETDFRLVYYAPENSDDSAVPYLSGGIGTFYYRDGSRYEGKWSGKSGKETDWNHNFVGRFFDSDGTEFIPDDIQLRCYERDERAVFGSLWNWAPGKPIQKPESVEPILWKLIDDLIIPTQQLLSENVTQRDILFRFAVACLTHGSKEIEDIVLPPELMDMDFASVKPQRLVELLDANMPTDSQWKRAFGDSKNQLRATALFLDLNTIVPILADYAREEAKRAQEAEETEKKENP